MQHPSEPPYGGPPPLRQGGFGADRLGCDSTNSFKKLKKTVDLRDQISYNRPVHGLYADLKSTCCGKMLPLSSILKQEVYSA